MTATKPATRTEIEAEIIELRIKQDRMPSHWEKRRVELAADIDRLVDRWLRADA